MTKKKVSTRAVARSQILQTIPGNDCASQRQRVLMAMQTVGASLQSQFAPAATAGDDAVVGQPPRPVETARITKRAVWPCQST